MFTFLKSVTRITGGSALDEALAARCGRSAAQPFCNSVVLGQLVTHVGSDTLDGARRAERFLRDQYEQQRAPQRGGKQPSPAPGLQEAGHCAMGA